MKIPRYTSRIDTLHAQLDGLGAEIDTMQAHYDASYNAVLVAEKDGDASAVVRHDAWLERFDAMLVSLRASRYAAEREYNGLLVEAEAE